MIFQFLFLILNLFLVCYLIFLVIEILNFIIRKMPTVPTSSQAIDFILEIIEGKSDGRKTFVDLGCGWARVLIAVKKKYPKMEVIGYENLPTQFLLAKIAVFFSGTKAKVFYKDLFRADLTNADIVFCYLYPHLMKGLENKLEKELKEGALVIANAFPLSGWQPHKIIKTASKNPDCKKIFIYPVRSSLGTKIIYPS